MTGKMFVGRSRKKRPKVAPESRKQQASELTHERGGITRQQLPEAKPMQNSAQQQKQWVRRQGNWTSQSSIWVTYKDIPEMENRFE